MKSTKSIITVTARITSPLRGIDHFIGGNDMSTTACLGLRFLGRDAHVPRQPQPVQHPDDVVAGVDLPPAQTVAGGGRERVMRCVPPSPIARTPNTILSRLSSALSYGPKPHRWHAEFTLQVTW